MHKIFIPQPHFMQSKTESILKIMHVLAWITFIALLVNAGGIFVSFIISLSNPEITEKLYMGKEFYPVRQYSIPYFVIKVTLKLLIHIWEILTAYLVIEVLSKIKMKDPFKIETSKLMEKISYYILITWVISMSSNVYNRWLAEEIPGLKEDLISGEFIFIAGIVFVFSQIFKKGVEIQTENELTV